MAPPFSYKLFIAANINKCKRDLRFLIVRYRNVMGSRGSVIPIFLEDAKTGVLPIIDPAMTRFNISLARRLRDGVMGAGERPWR